MFRVVIPARFASTRLPGKPLLLLAGRPMIEHVYRRACASGAFEVIVATDDERIAAVCAGFGADVVMTDPCHPSGTDRLAEVVRIRQYSDDEIIVNVQGDEPLLPAENVAQVAALLAADRTAAIATLGTPVTREEEYFDPNAVKVVCDVEGRALYFSRAPIPWCRDAEASEVGGVGRFAGALRHIGLYSYRVSALRALADLKPTPLERLERLEQLRALENGLRIVVGRAAVPPGPSVDTQTDLLAVAALLSA